MDGIGAKDYESDSNIYHDNQCIKGTIKRKRIKIGFIEFTEDKSNLYQCDDSSGKVTSSISLSVSIGF